MSDYEEIKFIREKLKELQTKLESRSKMLSRLIPFVEEAAEYSVIGEWKDFTVQYSKEITKFREEYAQEVRNIENKQS